MSKFDFQQKINRLLKQLFFLGLWRDILSSKLDTLYFFAVIAVFNVNLLLQMINVYFVFGDLKKFNLQVLVVLTDIFVNVKVYYLLRYKKSFVNFSKTINRSMFQPKNLTQEEMTRGTFKAIDRIYLLFRLTTAFTVAAFGIYPLVQESELGSLPFLAWYPFDVESSSYLHSGVFFHQMFCQFWGSQVYVNVDTLHFTLLAIIIAQFDILSDDLRNLFQARDSVRTDELFVECVHHHKEILLFFKEVYQMLNVCILVQFVSTISALCLLLFMITTAQLNTLFLAIVFFVLTFVSELLFYCWWGNEVILKSMDLPKAAFESNWIEGSPAMKKKIQFFIHRTQTPTIIFAIDLFKVDLPNFLMILRHTYSCYTVLRHVNNS